MKRIINKWSKEDSEFLLKNYQLPKDELCKSLNRNLNSIVARIKWFKSIGVIPFKYAKRHKIYDNLGEDNVFFVKLFFPSYGLKYCLEKKPNLSKQDIFNIAATFGLKRKIPQKRIKRNFDFKSFIKLEKEAVYLLGFIWGDGHVNPKSKIITINNIYDDLVNILPLFLKYGNVYFCDRNRKNRQKQLMIDICNEELFLFLKENAYLIKSGASANLILNKIPEHLKHYWWRGYFDADGGVYFNEDIYGNTTTSSMSITSSYAQDWDFVISLFKELNIVNYDIYLHQHKKDCGKSSAVRISKRDEMIKFLSYIYKDHDMIGLNRKYIKYLELSEHLKYQQENPYYFN
jgi:hypothetical protein